MLKKIFFITICISMMQLTAHARDYYVDCSRGSDTNDGSAGAPLESIQCAAERVSAGDSVIVRPGVYYGPINVTAQGTKEKPIVFYAEKGGEYETVITNADRDVRENEGSLWECVDEENNIWAMDYTVKKNAHIDLDNPDWLFPARVLCGDVDLLPYSSYEGLKTSIFYKDDTTYLPGYPQGYFYDHAARKIYVRLRTDGKYTSPNPNKNIMKIAPSIYLYISVSGGWGGGAWHGNAMGRDSYNICVGNYNGLLSENEERAPSYNVILDGFTFETPGFAGVFLRASDVTVRNCYFKGCRTGVRGAARVRSGDMMYSDNILIEHCDYSQFPTFDDAKDLILEYDGNEILYEQYVDEEGKKYDLNTYFWWQRKGYNKNFDYESGGFTNFMGKNWILKYNYIHDCFDGLSYQSMQKYADTDGVEHGAEFIEIYGNTFEKCLDNAIEFENHGRNIKVYENRFYDNFVPISWQPLGGTPWPTNIRFYKNVIHNTRDFNSFWTEKAGFTNYAFKIGANKSNWKNYPWMEGAEWDEVYDIPKGDVEAEDEGVWIFNNTVVMPGAKLLSNVGGKSMTRVPFFNFRFINNALVCSVSNYSVDNNGVKNADIAYKGIGIEFSHNIFAPDAADRYQITDEVLTDGKYVSNAENLGFALLTRLRLNPELKEDSPLIGFGITDRHEPQMNTDVGALSYNEPFKDFEAGVLQDRK